MTIFTRLLTGAAVIGCAAAPASAQYQYPTYPQQYPQQYPGYPQQQYPQQYPGYPQGYGYGQNSVGAIIDQLLGNRYNATDRAAVSHCAGAAMAQAAREYPPQGYGYQGYGGQGYGGQGYAYNQGYGGFGHMRITAITEVQRRTSGLRVRGLIDSGMGYGHYGGQGYGGQGYGYNQGYADPRYAGAGDLKFRCTIDYRGYVSDVRITHNDAYRRY
jgi:hypothetical protein